MTFFKELYKALEEFIIMLKMPGYIDDHDDHNNESDTTDK